MVMYKYIIYYFFLSLRIAKIIGVGEMAIPLPLGIAIPSGMVIPDFKPYQSVEWEWT